MTDPHIKYQNLGQVGAMGDNAHVEILHQGQGEVKTFNFSLFLEQLGELRKGLDEAPNVTQDQKDAAIVVIQNAKEAAKAEDEAGIKKSLGKAGNWVLAVCEKLGIQVVAALIKDQLQGS